MPTLLILSSNKDDYAQFIKAAQLPDLEFTAEPEDPDIVLGEPKLIRDMLPRLPNLKWVQAIYAGVERLMDPALRRDYTLTNARGVFGELMSEYVFGYLLSYEKKIFERQRAQRFAYARINLRLVAVAERCHIKRRQERVALLLC